jgi:glucokinase
MTEINFMKWKGTGFNMSYRIGIDLGGTNIAAGIVSDSYEILSKASVPTKRERSADEIIEDIVTLVHSLVKEQNLTMEDIASIGIGEPGTACLKR